MSARDNNSNRVNIAIKLLGEMHLTLLTINRTTESYVPMKGNQYLT